MMVCLWRRLFRSILAKLEKWKHGLFQVAQKINDNAYVLQLPDDQNISYTLNVVDLFAYNPNDEELYKPNSMMGSFPNEGD